jgi:flagellar biosynthesis protein FlhG
MAEIVADQAEGLRRLLAEDFTRVITLAGGSRGIGTTTLLINLGVALARSGKRVLLLDEQDGTNSICAKLGLKSGADVYEAIHQGKSLSQVAQAGPHGVSVVPAARVVRAMPEFSGLEQRGLVELFRNLPEPFDVVLIDGRSGSANHALSLSLAAQEVALVVGSNPASITDAYALIKVLARDFDLQRFHVLVNRVDGEKAGMLVFENMAGVARRHLGVRVELMGIVPEDAALEQALRQRRAVAEVSDKAPASLAMRRIAENLEGWPRPCGDDRRLVGFAQRLIQGSRIAAHNISAGILAGAHAKG